MKIYQFSCMEGKVVDMRQADAVLRHRPDVIIFEASSQGNTPGLLFNEYSPSKKPLREVAKHQKTLKKLARSYPWVESDIYVYENIVKLWREGHDVKLYHVDAPSDLLLVRTGVDNGWNPKPCRRGTHLLWWVRIYLREKIMTGHIRGILSAQPKDSTVLVFLQSFHWRNVQFQLTKPSKKKMWEYYFGLFRGLTKKAFAQEIRESGKVLDTYWKHYSDFT